MIVALKNENILFILSYFVIFEAMKAMLLSAGLGTRLRPFTDRHPKALAPIGDRTLLEINIRKLVRAGIRDIVVNVHHFAGQIIDAVRQHNGFGANVLISDETAVVLETGGGVQKAAPLFDNEENILVCNVDILSNIDINALYACHRQYQAAATLAVQHRSTSRNLLFDRDGNLKGWQNNVTGEVRPPDLGSTGHLVPFAFSGIQILNRKLYQNIPLQGKFSLIDVYLHCMNSHVIKGFDHTGDVLLDVGKPEALEKARAILDEIS